MEKEVYMQQGLDLRRLLLVLGRRLWLAALGILVGALAGAGIYLVYTGITNGEPEYRASSDYYISFNFGEFEHGDDYYNAYTWDGILRDDDIVDYALTLLPEGITKAMVQDAVQGEMLGDYRILTVHVTTHDPVLTQQIAESYHGAMVYFGEIKDMLDHIEVWSRGEVVPLEKNTKAANAAFLGGLLGGLAVLFGLLVYVVMQDAFYVEKDLTRRFGLPVYGLFTSKKDERQERIYRDNLHFAFGEAKVETWNVERVPRASEYEGLRQADAVLLEVCWGRNNGARTERILELMEIQQCRVRGFLLTDADAGFLKAYYGLKKSERFT
ncbi:MAG: hypothetical protein MR383_06820 [Lachnospiraceae bacterium]|nr:hypothetical protein [Lachnospiraceae bacterium]